MTQFDHLLKRGTSIASLLAEAGMDPAQIKQGRSFATNWGWKDDSSIFTTIWVEEIRDLDTAPKWSFLNSRLRSDLSGRRRNSAQALFDMLAESAGEPVRVILQTRKPDREKWGSGVADRRGVDPEPWLAALVGDTVYMQRGTVLELPHISVSGKPMPSRPPGLAFRETRPEQVLFRKRVGAKSGNRCALTGAPYEVCDAAHFPWADWRTDNDACHGVLIRRDLHAALDCQLLAIDESGHVLVSEYLGAQSAEYRKLEGKLVPI